MMAFVRQAGRTGLCAVLGALASTAGFAQTGAPAAAPAPSIPAPVYRVKPPAGKLPLPQHDPAFTQAQYDSMMQQLYIAQNFPEYQDYSRNPKTVYLHDGLDDMLPNGTKIFAVASGTVRYINGRMENYKSVVIEDDDHPGHAWSYTHVDSFQVKVGDHVPQGTYIAKVRFRDADSHTHLDRVWRPEGGVWSNPYSMHHSNPIAFVELPPDREPPVVETPFR